MTLKIREYKLSSVNKRYKYAIQFYNDTSCECTKRGTEKLIVLLVISPEMVKVQFLACEMVKAFPPIVIVPVRASPTFG